MLVAVHRQAALMLIDKLTMPKDGTGIALSLPRTLASLILTHSPSEEMLESQISLTSLEEPLVYLELKNQSNLNQRPKLYIELSTEMDRQLQEMFSKIPSLEKDQPDLSFLLKPLLSTEPFQQTTLLHSLWVTAKEP